MIIRPREWTEEDMADEWRALWRRITSRGPSVSLAVLQDVWAVMEPHGDDMNLDEIIERAMKAQVAQ